MKYQDTPKEFQKLITLTNKIMEYFVREAKIRKFPPLNEEYWSITTSLTKDSWTFKSKFTASLPVKKSYISKRFGSILAIIHTGEQDKLIIEYGGRLKFFFPKWRDVAYELASTFLVNTHVTPAILENILVYTTVLPHASDLRSALENWTYGSSYKYMNKYAEKLNKMAKYLPEKARISPSNTLYRCVFVDKSLVNKVLEGKKTSLNLKDRLYSSWSYSLEATKIFGNNLTSSFYRNFETQEARILILLKRTFADYQILLNVEEAGKILHFMSSSVTSEREIIVKNVKRDFKFKPQEIILFKQKRMDEWAPFNELSRHS